MRFDVLTIFPTYFDSPLRVGLLSKAIADGRVAFVVHDLRRWAPDPRKVDDEPFGGGPGMVITPEPVVAAAREVLSEQAHVIALTPGGRRLDQGKAAELAGYAQLILICGRYEGIDQRAIEVLGAEEISIGDFVLTGGEAAALCLIEAVARLDPEYLGNLESLREESFSSGLLEYPHYTRPAIFEGKGVPEVLLSGDHGKIALWRREQALRRTFERRPDLLEAADLSETERQMIEEWASEERSG